MAILSRLLIAFSMSLAPTALAAEQGTPPIAERVKGLSDAAFQSWFGTMLTAEYRTIPDWELFFGDVGPTAGCDALSQIKKDIATRDLSAFRVAYIAVVKEGFSPTALADVPDRYLRFQFDSRIDRFRRDLKVFLRPRVMEMGRLARQWADSHGYRGRRLGYNKAGVAYWGNQPAMTTLVCTFPNDRGLLHGWQK